MAPDGSDQAALCSRCYFCAGPLHAQFSPQLHFGPQVQGSQAHCFFSHWSVILRSSAVRYWTLKI